MKLYREVKCEDRLPDEQKQYMTVYGWCTYHPILKEWRQMGMQDGYIVINPGWWLEPIEITEGEIGKMAEVYFPSYEDESEDECNETDMNRWAYIQGAKAILSKLN